MRRAGRIASGLALLALAACQEGGTGQSTGTANAAPQTPGERLYAYHCAPCHAAGPGHPGTAALELKHKGEIPALLTERTDLAPDAVRYFVRHGVNAMPYFRKTEISDAELDEIARFLDRTTP